MTPGLKNGRGNVSAEGSKVFVGILCDDDFDLDCNWSCGVGWAMANGKVVVIGMLNSSLLSSCSGASYGFAFGI